MRVGRTAVAGLLAGGLALSLVAAASTPAIPSVGSAATRLLGAQLEVTGPLATPAASLLDLVTEATTGDAPHAATTVVPIQIGDERMGATGASSDGNTSSTSTGTSLGSAGAPLGLDVSPIETTATASAQRALATIGAATGELSALLGQLGLRVDTAGVTSLVTAEEAAATQGLQVSGLSLALADLGLDADLLGQLGLGDILALLEQLPIDAPSELADVSGVLGDISALEDALGDLETAAAPVLDLAGDLALIGDALPEVETLDALLASLESLLDLDAVALLDALTDTDLLASLDAVGCGLDGLTLLNVEGALADAIACVEGELSSIGSDLSSQGISGVPGDPSALLGALEDIQDSLAGLMPAELAGLVAQFDVISALLEEVLASLGGLEELLDLLPGLLDEAAGLELLDVGAFDLGTTAVAGDSLATSSASVLCDASAVTVLGTSIPTPDCSEALSGLSDISDQVNAAFGQVTGILNSLPLAGDLVQVGDLRAEMFTNLVEDVTETDGVITSTAGFNLLELAIPSITVDATQVTDPLGGLGLPDVLGPVQDVLDELQAGLDGISVLSDVLATVNDLENQLLAPTGMTGTVDQVSNLLAGLALDDLGTLAENLRTPGLQLLIDPVSTATFTAGAPGETSAPAPDAGPDPAAAPGPQPSLPSTGGGLALLGALAMSGAGALRRRS